MSLSNLPKIKQPIYTHYLTGLKKEVKFRPFTVAEQKILLLAKEEKSKEAILNSMEQVLNNCILSKDVNILDLPYFDIEDIFVRIRAKSVGEIIETKYAYDYEDEDGNKKTDYILIKINTDDIKIKNVQKENKIIVQDDPVIGIKMKMPTLQIYKEMENLDDETEAMFKCIDFIYDETKTYSDFTKKDLEEFIDDLDALAYKKFEKFFNDMPHLYYEINVRLPKLDKEEKIVFNSLSDFFF